MRDVYVAITDVLLNRMLHMHSRLSLCIWTIVSFRTTNFNMIRCSWKGGEIMERGMGAGGSENKEREKWRKSQSQQDPLFMQIFIPWFNRSQVSRLRIAKKRFNFCSLKLQTDMDTSVIQVKFLIKNWKIMKIFLSILFDSKIKLLM